MEAGERGGITMQYVCETIMSAAASDFDNQVTYQLNLIKWAGWSAKVQFNGDETMFIAHIIFSKEDG